MLIFRGVLTYKANTSAKQVFSWWMFCWQRCQPAMDIDNSHRYAASLCWRPSRTSDALWKCVVSDQISYQWTWPTPHALHEAIKRITQIIIENTSHSGQHGTKGLVFETAWYLVMLVIILDQPEMFPSHVSLEESPQPKTTMSRHFVKGKLDIATNHPTW